MCALSLLMAGEFLGPRLSADFNFDMQFYLKRREKKEPLLPVLPAPWLAPSSMHISNSLEHVANVN